MKLHTGCSRNELVATDFRLFVKDAAAQIKTAVAELVAASVALAKGKFASAYGRHDALQHAQPILLSHFLLAHGEAFLTDIPRLESAASSADASSDGLWGALAGCSSQLTVKQSCASLVSRVLRRTGSDAVGDRDFALDYLFRAC